MLAKLKVILEKVLPPQTYLKLSHTLEKMSKYLRGLIPSISFLRDDNLDLPFKERLRIIKQLYVITSKIRSPHSQYEMLAVIRTILSLPPESNGVIVEAGCFKGSSTAKFSLAADIVGRNLVVFDSFEGLPENDEPHDKTIYGGTRKIDFSKGSYCGSLEEVKLNVARFGKIDRCKFVKGWFEDTMPHFAEPISVIYVDVDLVSSTRTCLKYLFPLLEDGGVLYSQDGHLPLVIDVYNDRDFWWKEVGCKKPSVQGLGEKTLLKIIKEAK